MDADGRVEPGEAIDERERPLRRRAVPARDQDPLDAGQPRGAEHELDVVGEAIGVDVAVGIDEAHPAMLPAADPRQAAVVCHRPTSEPSVSRTTANRPIPPPMSIGCSRTVPPFAVAAAQASSSESTVM